MIKFGNIIRYHRKKSNLSRVQLAILAGVGKTVVYDIENGKGTVQFRSFLKICDALNIIINLDSPIMDYCLKEVDGEKG